MWATVSSGSEAAVLSKRLKAELEGAEIKMLSFFLGVSRRDRSRSRDIRRDSICWRFGT